ncbi:MAG: hypothetical protein K2H26_04160 [Ruminococcus sp.]|nr:hypothetical protein [Ruminococcus sp.]
MNPLAITKSLTKIKPMLRNFKEGHPKFFPFIKMALTVADPDSVVEVKITTSEGKSYATNLKITEDDMKLVTEAKNILL